MSYQRDRDEFVGVVVAEVIRGGFRVRGSERQGTELARLILRNAATLQRLGIDGCNRELTPGEKKQDEDCEQRIRLACERFGIEPTFSGDPRGAVVKLLLPSGRWNSFGGPECGFCVPTR